jgi:hypothetical protein
VSVRVNTEEQSDLFVRMALAPYIHDLCVCVCVCVCVCERERVC